jgi:hypothetical protein
MKREGNEEKKKKKNVKKQTRLSFIISHVFLCLSQISGKK